MNYVLSLLTNSPYFVGFVSSPPPANFSLNYLPILSKPFS